VLVTETLQHLLDNGQASDNLVKFNDLFQPQRIPASENLNPNGSVKQDQWAHLATPPLEPILPHGGEIALP